VLPQWQLLNNFCVCLIILLLSQIRPLMLKRFLNLVILCCGILITFNCANRGTPSGGEKDIQAPIITKTEPENFSTNFTSKEIRIYFDEFIKIKNLQKNLIISPPMDPAPEVTPLGSASKYISIKIHDTLQPNTTYAFNFGESIVDNNEENAYQFYRYVFSTGDYIDSLKVSGSIKDAYEFKADEFVSVMLYEVDSTFTDSIIYKKKPKYITSTLDSITTFQLENLKDGKYLMVALKDKNSNYIYEPKSDKIGFVDNFITVPSDSSYTINLFKEELDFKVTRPSLVSGQKIQFGYEGSHEEVRLNLLNKPSNLNHKITKDPETDSLYFWYKPKLDSDSLLFEVSKRSYVDTFTVKINDQLNDSLLMKPLQTGAMLFTENFELEANIPIIDFDKTKVSFIDKDSLDVNYQVDFASLENKYTFTFDKSENNIYRFKMFPGAFTDFFGNVNDTLQYNLQTREYSDYGNLRLTLQNAIYPVIVQLVSVQGKVIAEKISEQQEILDYRHLSPGDYYIRVIFDANKNGKYDPGNYLLKRQSERVSYYNELQEIRSNFDYIINFELLD